MTIRYAGLALMVGVALAFVAPLHSWVHFRHPYFPERPGRFVLAQWMTFITLVSLLLMSFGFLASTL